MFNLSISISKTSFKTVPAEKQNKTDIIAKAVVLIEGSIEDDIKMPISTVNDGANPFQGLPSSSMLRNLFFENLLAKNLSIRLIAVIYY